MGFVLLGLAMIAVAAAAGLREGLAVTFAVLGVGLVVLGGLAARLEGPVELGASGVKGVLRARDVALEGQRVAAEAQRPEEAERYGEVVEAIDDWFADYLRQPRDSNPFAQAMKMQIAYDNRREKAREARH